MPRCLISFQEALARIYVAVLSRNLNKIRARHTSNYTGSTTKIPEDFKSTKNADVIDEKDCSNI